LGLFITLEGIDGAGKSTQARLLADRLRAAGHEVVLTREPGGAPGAEEIRRLLVEGAPGRWSPETEILLFTAARRDHLERVIAPALGRGAFVVCDRFVDSTRAYQGEGRLRATVERLHAMMIGRDPDLTLILDMDPDAGLGRSDAKAADRSRQGHRAENRFERRGGAFQAQMRRAFLAIAAAEPSRCRVVDAARPVEAVADEIWRVVAERLAA
jgi:dTMP kinase